MRDFCVVPNAGSALPARAGVLKVSMYLGYEMSVEGCLRKIRSYNRRFIMYWKTSKQRKPFGLRDIPVSCFKLFLT